MLSKNGLLRCCAAVFAAGHFVVVAAVLAETPTVAFSKRCLIVDMNEGCDVADVNRDGKPDIIAGEHWYAAPDFVPRPLRQIPPARNFGWLDGHISASTGDRAYDVNRDGWVDVVSVGWTDREIAWYENPGLPGLNSEYTWKRHVLAQVPGGVESLALRDFDGDGRPEIYVCGWGDERPLSIYRFAKDAQGQPGLQPTTIGPVGGAGHGYGFGDVNGDGREDILCASGWYERPAGDIFTRPWKLHRETALPMSSCPFIVAKLTNSGRNDIIWSKAHDYGIYWWEQGQPKPDGTTTWAEHLIDKSWSQPHGMVWTDIDGDGQPELITGKRVRAHVDQDPGSKEPEGLYYYKWDKDARKFTRHTISGPGEGVGMGMQICVADLNGDGRPDIVVAGKSGTWILLNQGPEKRR